MLIIIIQVSKITMQWRAKTRNRYVVFFFLKILNAFKIYTYEYQNYSFSRFNTPFSERRKSMPCLETFFFCCSRSLFYTFLFSECFALVLWCEICEEKKILNLKDQKMHNRIRSAARALRVGMALMEDAATERNNLEAEWWQKDKNRKMEGERFLSYFRLPYVSMFLMFLMFLNWRNVFCFVMFLVVFFFFVLSLSKEEFFIIPFIPLFYF